MSIIPKFISFLVILVAIPYLFIIKDYTTGLLLLILAELLSLEGYLIDLLNK